MKSIRHIQRLIGAITIILTFTSNAQELQRKASLGVSLEPMNDSISAVHRTEKGKGVLIPSVQPNSTASKAGIVENSVLLNINGNEVNSISDVLEEVRDLRNGDQVELTYCKNRKVYAKKVKAISRPIETSEYADITYGQVDYAGNQLRSILYTPKGVDRAPVVYFLQGLPCQSVEYLNAQEISLKQLMHDWVKAGYAVYRVEKPGMGDSNCDKGCFDINFHEEVEAFRQGYLSLQKVNGIDPENIFLFGHSLGGIVAPVLAQELNPKGVITYGTLVNSWFEYMQELTRVQGEIFHSPFEEIERDLRRSTPFWYELMVAQKTNLEILENDSIANMLEDEGILEEFKNGYFMGRHYTYWPTLNNTRLFNTWLDVKSHTLAIYGALDIQALNSNHVKTIAAIVNSQHPGKGSFKIIPNADHNFIGFDSMEDNVQSINNGEIRQRLYDSYHPGIAASTVEWMNKIRKL